MVAYSAKAQPYLDAIAQAAFSSSEVRNWIIAGTPFHEEYKDAASLHDLQQRLRPNTKQPFYCNYWCGKDSACQCRVAGSKGLETDILLFMENSIGKRLCVHVEFKHRGEKLSFGQADSYPLRAACWADRSKCPKRVVPHDDWMTAIFCDSNETDAGPFMRKIDHHTARRMISGYPS